MWLHVPGVTLRRAGRLLSRMLLRKARLKLPPLPPPQAASPSLPRSWSKASSPRLQGATPLYLGSLGRGWNGRAGSQRAGVTTHSPLLWPGPAKGLGHSLSSGSHHPPCGSLGAQHQTSVSPLCRLLRMFLPRGRREDVMPCCPHLSSGQLQHPLGWHLLPWRRKWQPTPVFLPGESHGQRSLVGYSPQIAKSRTRLRDFTFTPSEIPARALQWSQGPGVMGTEARIFQQPDQKTTVRGWDIQGVVLCTSPSMLLSASEPPDFIPGPQELPSTGLTQPSCFPHSSRLPQSAATLPPRGTDICPHSQLPFPFYSSFISPLECRTSLFQEPLQDGPRDPHSPQRPPWVW